MSDGWNTEPFTLMVDEKTGQLIGRGSTDDKGPILGWLNVLEAHHTLGLELPVNLRFCFEGMEESASEGLDALIKAEASKGSTGYFDGVDCVCIVSYTMLTYSGCCITYHRLYASRRLPVRHLLDEHTYTVPHVRFAWDYILQSHRIRPRARSALWRIRSHGLRTYD